MDADIITLSSDEDESPMPSNEITSTTDGVDCLNRLQEKLRLKLSSVNDVGGNENTKGNVSRFQGNTPEVVDLVDCNDKSLENDPKNETSEVQNHSKTNNVEGNPSIKGILKTHVDNKATNSATPNDKNGILHSLANNETGTKSQTNNIPQGVSCPTIENSTFVNNCKNDISSDISTGLNIFTEFMDFCASLEENPKDREKLREKLKKYFSNAHPKFIVSDQFRILIQKHRNTINKNNLYIVAKLIADELKLHKIVEVQVGENAEKSNVETPPSPRQQKRLAKIRKIVKKLNHLGNTIRELEKEDVDLSDEEDSVYLKLQRYRERFWLIYKKLSEITNDADIHRIFNQRIHFSETDYPAINRCIEKWLNKTKRFPDFADIMKILENQSTELGLPSNSDSLRSLAIEIFQKVGNILQIRRKYDLWDSFCGFLEDTEDPAVRDPELEKIFKENYETRIKKEQEIYQHFVERQEKESLQAKEVPEEDAYISPESGNEEEEEIKNIEMNLAARLADNRDVKYTDGDKQIRSDPTSTCTTPLLKEKESKNNFKNCKSLKWRSKSDGSDNSATDTEAANGGKPAAPIRNANDSVPELTFADADNQKKTRTPIRPSTVSVNGCPSPKRRALSFGKENSPSKKKRLDKDETNLVEVKEGEKLKKTPVFEIGYCQIVTKERRKIFRDLTNLNKLMKTQGLNKIPGLFTPSFLYSRNTIKDIPWNKRYRVNLREVKPKNRKCALNEEEKTNEKITSDSSRKSKSNDSKDNTEGEKEGADFSGQGNGQEEDNNDKGDENRNNGKVDDENDDHEEDDDEEKEEENVESGEHSSNAQKTDRESEDLLEPNDENHTLEESECIVQIETGNDQRRKKPEAEMGEYEDESSGGNKLEDAEEFESFKNSLEPICVLKEEDSEMIERINPVSRGNRYREKTCRNSQKLEEKFKTGPFTRSKTKTENKNETHNQRRLPGTPSWTPPAETSQPKPRKMSASDEERVKRFLMHSPSSISITPPKKLTLSKPPSQSALQALATLRNLKGISATIVKGKPKTEEDVTVIGGPARRQTDQSTQGVVKRRRGDLPVISNVQSVNTLTPKIVTVQGNVSGFGNLWPETTNNGNTNPNSSSIRISKVWGSLPETVVQGNPPSNYPGCSSRKSNPGTSNQMRKKTPKKQVEYVVLD